MKSKTMALLLSLFAGMAFAQTSPAPVITGEWDGAIAGKLRVAVKIEKADDQSLHGSLTSIDQGGAKLPIDVVSFDGKQAVRFEWKKIGASYEGTLNPGGTEISGNWQQGGTRVPLLLRRSGAAGPTALKPVVRGKVPLEPCTASDGTQALCGSYEVFENRKSRGGRKIALNLMLLPAMSEKPAADAVLAFAGGPGQGAVATFPLASYITALRRDRDIVLVDERGTGKSNPLPCPVDLNNVQALVSGSYPPEWLGDCRATLEKRADLTQYTTSIAIDDADEVRDALGYDKVDVVGGSYGSLASLVYLRRHPDHVQSMAILGVIAPDHRMPLTFARTIQSAVEHLFANCAADAACHKAYPELKSEFEATLKRLDEQPAKFEFAPSPGAKPQPVTLTRGAFVSGLRTILYQPALVSQLPMMLHSASQNNWQPYASATVLLHRALAGEIARGMSLSVICSEAVPFIQESEVASETRGTYLGDHDIRNFQQRCSSWPHAAMGKDFLAPIRSAIPVLLISGADDPATPPALAEHAAQYLSHGRVVAIPEGTHLTGSACVDKMIAQFVSAGSEKAVDAGCVQQVHRPDFAVAR